MKKTKETIIFNFIAVVVTTLFSLCCILPLLYTVSGSLTKESALYRGMKLIPQEFSLDAYRMIFNNPNEIFRAYFVTILLVVLGTFFGLLICSMTAYVLYRPDFKYRNYFSFFFFFTTLFSGGLVPFYIWITSLNMRNTFWVLLIPWLVNVFNFIVMRTYFTSNIPVSLVEAASVDGAQDFYIYLKIILPSAKPILATIGLLTGIWYWNNWSVALTYITEKNLYPLQYYLYSIFQSTQLHQLLAEQGISQTTVFPQESYKLAMTVFVMGPVILFYPFVQKYFVTGLTIGAVKG